MSDSLPRNHSETARHRLRLMVSDSKLDNALWNITPRSDIPQPLYLFSMRSFLPDQHSDLLIGEYKQSVYHALGGKKFEYDAAKPVQIMGEYAVKFLVRFGHEDRDRIITEPLIDQSAVSGEERTGHLAFLYAFSPPVNAKLASRAMRDIEGGVGVKSLSSLAVVSDENPFATSIGVLMPSRHLLDADGA